MPTQVYRLESGERVPSVTTVLGRFKDSGGLIAWAHRLGLEGKDYRQVRDEAANAGTLAHAAIEKWINGAEEPLVDAADETPGVTAEIILKAKSGFNAFLMWANQTKLKVVAQEEALVSEKHRFGGCLDAVLEIDGKLSLGDWKTSNRLYRDYLCQIAAYGELWNENHPDKPIDGGFHLCRFSKDHADFDHRYFSELGDAWLMFRHLRAALELDKKLKKRV
jgi:hypothetical protein